MAEYTFENLLLNPESPDLKSLVGKEVYYSNIPIICIRNANNDSSAGILEYVRECESYPFYVKTDIGSVINYACIILKKEEPKPKYVPFENIDEFLSVYCHIVTKDLDGVHRYLSTNGIWLKEKRADDPDTFCMVHEMRKEGVFVGHADVVIDDGISYTTFAPWSKLCQGYTFLDGSPCGKL